MQFIATEDATKSLPDRNSRLGSLSTSTSTYRSNQAAIPVANHWNSRFRCCILCTARSGRRHSAPKRPRDLDRRGVFRLCGHGQPDMRLENLTSLFRGGFNQFKDVLPRVEEEPDLDVQGVEQERLNQESHTLGGERGAGGSEVVNRKPEMAIARCP